jgi:hypothetical protein
MKNILFLFSLYHENYRNRFGIDILKKNFKVKIFDCTPWMNKKYWDLYSKNLKKNTEHIIVSNKKDFLNYIPQINNVYIIENLPNNRDANWIRKMLKKKNCLFVSRNLNPIPVLQKNFLQKINTFFKLLINIKKFIYIINKFVQKKKNNLIKSNSEIFIVGGLASLKKLKKGNIIKAHSMDYDVYLNVKDIKRNEINKPYAVFLDQDMASHPDPVVLGLEREINEFKYYKDLTKFLKKFEADTKLKVIVSIHPKSKNQNLKNLLEGIEFSKENSAELVKNSSLTLLHDSTAISFAILFNKPTLFLTSNHLNKSQFGPRIKNVAKTVNSRIINMDDFLQKKIDTKYLFQIDQDKYKDYLDQYIKIPNSPNLPIWEIFSKQIKEKEF